MTHKVDAVKNNSRQRHIHKQEIPLRFGQKLPAVQPCDSDQKNHKQGKRRYTDPRKSIPMQRPCCKCFCIRMQQLLYSSFKQDRQVARRHRNRRPGQFCHPLHEQTKQHPASSTDGWKCCDAKQLPYFFLFVRCAMQPPEPDKDEGERRPQKSNGLYEHQNAEIQGDPQVGEGAGTGSCISNVCGSSVCGGSVCTRRSPIFQTAHQYHTVDHRHHQVGAHSSEVKRLCHTRKRCQADHKHNGPEKLLHRPSVSLQRFVQPAKQWRQKNKHAEIVSGKHQPLRKAVRL